MIKIGQNELTRSAGIVAAIAFADIVERTVGAGLATAIVTSISRFQVLAGDAGKVLLPQKMQLGSRFPPQVFLFDLLYIMRDSV